METLDNSGSTHSIETTAWDTLGQEVPFEQDAASVEQREATLNKIKRKIGALALSLFKKPTPNTANGQVISVDIASQQEAVLNQVTEPMQEVPAPSKFRDESDFTPDEKDLLSQSKSYRQDAHDAIKNQRAHELTERAFNAALTSIDSLETAFQVGEDGISKTEVEYNGKTIPVYNLNGLPFQFFQTTLDYKLDKGQTRDNFIIATNIAKAVFEDPAVWARHRSDVEALNTEVKSEQAGTTISLSYVDTEINLRTGGVTSEFGATYGFEHLPSDSILSITAQDGATNNRVGDEKTFLRSYKDPAALAENSRAKYNEVLVRRYDETGQPYLPDYMVVRNGNITDYTKRHAAYFNIPIINIEEEPYIKRDIERSIQKFNAISDGDSYETLADTLAYVKDSYPFDGNMQNPKLSAGDPNFGYHTAAWEIFHNEHPDLADKVEYIMTTLEPQKRADYLIQHLSSTIQGTEDDHMYLSANNRTRRSYGGGEQSFDCIKLTYTDDDRRTEMIFDSDNPRYQEIWQLVRDYTKSGRFRMVHDNWGIAKKMLAENPNLQRPA